MIFNNNLKFITKKCKINKINIIKHDDFVSLVKKNKENFSLVSIYEDFYLLKLNKGILKKGVRDLFFISKIQRSIIVGIVLSDAWVVKRRGWNSRIGFKQSVKHFSFFWNVFTYLSSLCSGYPWIVKIVKRGKLFYAIEMHTRQLLCLNEIHNLFYDIRNIKMIKEEIYDYLDYTSLAYWIMGDGSNRNKGITLCTDSFTIKEVVLLINILKIKFDINSTIHMEKNKPRIYINKLELSKLLPYIKPYFVYELLYKLSL